LLESVSTQKKKIPEQIKDIGSAGEWADKAVQVGFTGWFLRFKMSSKNITNIC
jgi:hypothetical protein